MARMHVAPHLCLDENPAKIASWRDESFVYVRVSDEVGVSFAISGTPDQVRATLAAMIAAIDTAEVD